MTKKLFFAQISTIWLYHNRKKFDVIQVNGAITNAKADVNAVHFVHSSWLKSPAHIFRTRCNLYSAYQWVYTAVNSILEQQSFQKARLIVAVSEKVKQELVKLSIPVKKYALLLME
ncbi:glycosyltransferase family 4 protein [Richelia intracellularis]|uniref:glycosyltransferase family 4 protein n=1 Tax=Richelia intracellularis TaxID=1164990 RepID=UPI002F2B43CE